MLIQSVASGWDCCSYVFLIPSLDENEGLPTPSLLKNTNSAIWSLWASGRPLEDPVNTIIAAGPQKDTIWNMAMDPAKTGTSTLPQYSPFGLADSSRSSCCLYVDHVTDRTHTQSQAWSARSAWLRWKTYSSIRNATQSCLRHSFLGSGLRLRPQLQ